MPDTPLLQAKFGQPGQQLAGCGFPVAHWLTLFNAHSGLLIKQLTAPLRTHDMAQVAQLRPELAEEDVLVGDTAFTSYVHLALLHSGICMASFALISGNWLASAATGSSWANCRPGLSLNFPARLIRKLGRYDQLVEYSKPSPVPQWLDEQTFRSLPDKLVVRELR